MAAIFPHLIPCPALKWHFFLSAADSACPTVQSVCLFLMSCWWGFLVKVRSMKCLAILSHLGKSRRLPIMCTGSKKRTVTVVLLQANQSRNSETCTLAKSEEKVWNLLHVRVGCAVITVKSKLNLNLQCIRRQEIFCVKLIDFDVHCIIRARLCLCWLVKSPFPVF